MPKYAEFHLETLEDRRMMAGDVTARVVNGDLVITGDNQSNEMYLYDNGDGSYVMFGENGTRINGLSGYPLDGVSDDIRINLRGGDNRIALLGLDLADDITIRTGSGNDKIILSEATIRSNLRMRTGGGDDSIRIMTSTILGQFNAATGAGNDEIAATHSAVGSGRVNTGRGNDEVNYFVFATQSSFQQNSGSGEDLMRVQQMVGQYEFNGSSGTNVYEAFLNSLSTVIETRNWLEGEVSVVESTFNISANDGTPDTQLDLMIG